MILLSLPKYNNQLKVNDLFSLIGVADESVVSDSTQPM